MPDQWPRALLRAALRELGYDALGAPGLSGALRYRSLAPDRGPVRVILVDHSAMSDEGSAAGLDALLRRHPDAVTILLARATSTGPRPGSAGATAWGHVVRRPASIAQLVAAVQTMLPLPPDSPRPLD